MSNFLDRAKGFYALALSDPQKACVEYIATNFVLQNPLPPSIPFGGTYHGAEGFVEYLMKLSQAIEMGPLEMDEWACDGCNVVVRGHEASKVHATGRNYSMRFVHWLTFDETGQLTSMLEYNDTAEMERAF